MCIRCRYHQDGWFVFDSLLLGLMIAETWVWSSEPDLDHQKTFCQTLRSYFHKVLPAGLLLSGGHWCDKGKIPFQHFSSFSAAVMLLELSFHQLDFLILEFFHRRPGDGNSELSNDIYRVIERHYLPYLTTVVTITYEQSTPEVSSIFQ